MNNQGYQQSQKQSARESSLSHAVNCLTYNRQQACCVRETYVREVYEYLLSQGGLDEQFAKRLPKDYIDSWEEFHQSHVKSLRPKDLTVCYLSGPEPLNDFNVLVKLGIQPHNIWAFESDNITYKTALEEIKNSIYPMLKLHKGNIENFFKNVPKKFDIIYLDTCGPLPSKEHNTIRLISTLLRHNRLNSPGALITNFAKPDLQDIKNEENFIYLVASYLYPKEFLEHYDESGIPVAVEGPATQGCDFLTEEEIKQFCIDFDEKFIKGNSFIDIVKDDFENYYSQYITRQLLDITSIIVPWLRLTNSDYRNDFFKLKPKGVDELVQNMQRFDNEGNGGELFTDPERYSLTWTLSTITTKYQNNFFSNWLQQLSGLPEPSIKACEAVKYYDILRYKSKQYYEKFYNSIGRQKDIFKTMFQFCDVPTTTLLFDIPLNQLSYPMHYSTEAIKRWSYKAKSTKMFVDVLILDECRYIYEWLPTLDLLEQGFVKDIAHQLSYRFALDGLITNSMWYNNEYFYGSAVIDKYTKNFEAKILSQRIKLE